MGKDFRIMRLDETAKIYSGVNVKSEGHSFGDGGCPWVMVEDLNNASVAQTSRFLTAEGMAHARIVPPGTVLFSSAGTVGKVGIAEVPMAPSNNIIAAEFREELVFPPYGMHCLAAMRPEFEAESRGAVYNSLRLGTFREFQIPVPSMEWQKNAAEELEKLRQGIEWQQNAIETVKKTAKLVFEERFADAVRGVIYQNQGTVLQKCAEIQLNGAAKKNERGGIKASYAATPQLEDWEIQWDGAAVVETEPSSAERCRLLAGDIVMNRINQLDRLGRCGLVADPPEENAVFGLNTLRIRADSDKIHPFFLFVWMTHPFVKQYIRSNAKSSTSFQSSLSKQTLMQLPLPIVEIQAQRDFAKDYGDCLEFVRNGRKILKKLRELQQIWYDKIRRMRLSSPLGSADKGTRYREKWFWTAPSGTDCFYDASLECIQVPVRESGQIKLFQLPADVDIQFVSAVRGSGDPAYGALDHFRLHRTGSGVWKLIHMQPVAYRPEGQPPDSEEAALLESSGLLSEKQDFGYIRREETLQADGGESAVRLIEKYTAQTQKGYSRYARLPARARTFVESLSPLQQAVYEEFLLAMQPLACHMVRRQILMRMGKETASAGIQDVIATVRLLENTGLLERRQGFYLNYYDDYKQGEERRLIMDYRGQPIPVDTWSWAEPRE